MRLQRASLLKNAKVTKTFIANDWPFGWRSRMMVGFAFVIDVRRRVIVFGGRAPF